MLDLDDRHATRTAEAGGVEVSFGVKYTGISTNYGAEYLLT